MLILLQRLQAIQTLKAFIHYATVLKLMLGSFSGLIKITFYTFYAEKAVLRLDCFPLNQKLHDNLPALFPYFDG